MKNKDLGKLLKTAGVALLVLGVICTIVCIVSCNKIGDYILYEPSIFELKDAIKTAERLAGMFSDNPIKDLAEGLDIPVFAVRFLKFSASMWLWLLILGGGCLAVSYYMKKNGTTKEIDMEKIKGAVSHGVGVVSEKTRSVIDSATVKCPKCGKLFTSNTSFCSACGTKLPEKVVEPKLPKQITCKNCGKVNSSSANFCSNCAAKLEVPVLTKKNCPACGMENKPEARFCCNCAAPLTAAPVPAEPVAEAPAATNSNYKQSGLIMKRPTDL